MRKINLVLADLDKKYIEHLSQYITTHYSTQFRINTFSRLDILEAFLSSDSDEIDIVLSTNTVLEHFKDKPHRAKLILVLTEELKPAKDDRMPELYKYQSGDKIAACLLEHFSLVDGSCVIQKSLEKNTKIVGIYSPSGGSGKTSITLALSGKLTDRGHSVMALSMEGFGSLTMPLYSSGNVGMSHILLGIKENPDLIGIKAEAKMTKDPNLGIFYLEPPECFAEFAELSANDLERLIRGLCETGKYEYLLIDMETGCDQRLLKIFDLIDHLILVSAPDIVSRHKFQCFIRQLQQMESHLDPSVSEKVYPVINKYNGGCAHDHTGGISTKVYSIPCINNLWTLEQGKYTFDQAKSMGNALTTLISDLRGEAPRG